MDDEVDCNSTKIIANKKISLYAEHCPSINTANFFLSQTSLDLYRILNATYHDSSKKNETQVSMSVTSYEDTEKWCILQ